MSDGLSLIVLSVALFASTTVDDLFILVGAFAAGRYRKRDIVVGQLIGIGTLTLTSVGLASAAAAIPRELMGLLGLVPVAIGALSFNRTASDDVGAGAARAFGRGTLAIASVALANGGDNLATYVPVFSGRQWQSLLLISGVFACMTGIWCWLAHHIANHPRTRAPLRRYAGWVFPLMLTIIGIHVLVRQGTIRWLWRLVIDGGAP